jgi:hypothetical protein
LRGHEAKRLPGEGFPPQPTDDRIPEAQSCSSESLPSGDGSPQPSSKENKPVPTNPNSRYVVRDGDRWAVRAGGAQRASSTHDTQAEAIDRAREIVTNLGGGEVTIQGRDGRFRDSDTVGGAPDPNPPRDTK